MSKPVTVVLVGSGARGELYASYALEHPDLMKVVAVAEPRREYRDTVVRQHDIPGNRVFDSWEELLEQPKLADAILVCTQDNMHRDPAIAYAEMGYHILLEKPMSTSPEECYDIVNAAKKNNVIFSVCHVLRYTRYTQKLKEVLASGVIGDIISMQHLEPVGYWHQAHSFVRGNWNNEQKATFMLLAKSCHDIDWVSYIMDSPCIKVSSFGNLSHFKEQNKPKGAADNCLDCTVESGCAYSARKVYLEGRSSENFLKIITPAEPTEENLTRALKEGPYGRCVYSCDNDVVDHQVVNFEFDGGKTVSFTMTAFTEMADRKTRIFGSKGCIEGNGEEIKVLNFVTDEATIYPITKLESNTRLTAHGGGDYYLMKSFVEAVATGDQSNIVSGPDETLQSHMIVFCAEKSRSEGRVVSLQQEVL